MEIYAVNCREGLNDRQFDNLLSEVDIDKQERIKRYSGYEDAQRTLIADILVRLAAYAKLNLTKHEFELYYNKYGKPYLRGYDSFYFNVSHSGEWVVCAVDSKEIGVDIEYISPIDIKIADRFFSSEESEMLRSKPSEEKLEYFYDIWTLKESYIKACGRGLSIPLDSFSVLKHDGYITFKSRTDRNNYCFKQYNIDIRYKFSVCGLNNAPEGCTIYDCSQLYNLYADIGEI